MMKGCKECGIEKELNKTNFTPNKECKGGFIKTCKECMSIRRREVYIEKNGTDKRRVWEEDEVNILKKYYPIMKVKELREIYLPNKTLDQIMSKANILKIKKIDGFLLDWTTEQIDYIKENYPKEDIPIDEIVANVGRWRGHVVNKAKEMGLVRPPVRRWTSKELDILKKNYPNMYVGELIEKFMPYRKVSQVVNHANKHGIFQDKSLKIKTACENLIKHNRSQKVTAPQRKINELLNKMNIEYINEFRCGYFLIDNYLKDLNLAIEVHGDYFHWHPETKKGVDKKSEVLRKDKSKNTQAYNKLGFRILYLWEKDINENIELCEKLILKYIENNGQMINYHSFNYELINNKLNLKEELIPFHY